MRRMVLLLALASSFAAGSCAAVMDREQLDLCRRVLPALHPEGTELREIRLMPAPQGGGGGIKIDYAAREPGAETQAHYVVCRFGTREPGKPLDLAELDTDNGPLGEARLLFLKRFWLDRPDTPKDSPGAQETIRAVPEIPQRLAYAAQQGINAIGGIGRIEGALIGGILLGLVEAGWSAYFDIDMRDIVVFSILVVMFVLRPGGLLGISGPHVRDV